MKAKRIWIIVLTVLIFLSGSVLGVSSLYRVDEVFVSANMISEEAEAERLQLQEQLNAAYEKKSSLFADETEATAAIAAFPYFRMTAFEKDYPNRLVVYVTEDMEVYAAPCDEEAGTYYILNADGMILGIRDNYTNRSDETGANNILLSGIEISGERGQAALGGEDFNGLLAFCKKADELLVGIRRNICSVTYMQRGNVTQTSMLQLTTREGVKIYVHEPAVAPTEKAVSVINEYLTLGDGERTRGMLAVTGTAENVASVYSPDDIFLGE